MAIDLGQLILPIILAFDLLAIIYIVFFERRNPANALVWIMALVFLPVLGFILYLLFGQHYFKEKAFRLKAEEDQRLIELFVEKQKSDLSNAKITRADVASDPLSQVMDLLLANDGALYTQNNQVRSYVNGRDKFDALLSAIEGARQHIHMEYYILRNDELGREVVSALTRKARQGVEVRLLYDALGNKIPREGYRDLVEAGGKVSEFYKVLIPSVSLKVNYHDHRKIAVIDGTTGFLGGFNIGDEYLGKGPLGFWRDTAVQINGPGAAALQFRLSSIGTTPPRRT
jgi:cardiolipin synthase